MVDLVLALSAVQRELAVQPDVDFRVSVTGRQQPLRPAARQEIYRIGREALVNAFCHSGAKCIELELEYAADSDLRMWVRDNGCGIDPHVLDAGREGHWGLAGMRERATRIGGLLKIYSSATTGTEVQLSIPTGVAFQLSPSEPGAEMLIIGCDYHPKRTANRLGRHGNGECGEKRLMHSDGEAERFYRELKRKGVQVRVGIEATGHSRWFERLLAELGFELWVGNAAEIRAARVRKQRNDRRDAKHILKLLMEDRFPKIWRASRNGFPPTTAGPALRPAKSLRT